MFTNRVLGLSTEKPESGRILLLPRRKGVFKGKDGKNHGVTLLGRSIAQDVDIAYGYVINMDGIPVHFILTIGRNRYDEFAAIVAWENNIAGERMYVDGTASALKSENLQDATEEAKEWFNSRFLDIKEFSSLV